MDTSTLTEFLGWCLIINSAILAITTIALITCKDFVSRVHSRLFKVSEESLFEPYFNYLSLFKVAVIVFNLTPYIALKIIA